MGLWGFFINLWLPLPLIFLGLMSIPIGPVQRISTNLCAKVLHLPLVAGFSLQWVCVLFTLVVWALMYQTMKKAQAVYIDASWTPQAQTTARAKKWRSERNMWIASFTVVVWILVGQMSKLRKKLARLQLRADSGRFEKKND